MRLKARHEHNIVALTVIYFLGTIAVITAVAAAYLVHECIVYEDGLQAAAVALVGQIVSIATLALGALGAMLSSTSPKPPPPPSMFDPNSGAASTPVTVVNTPEAPANVTEQPAPPDVDPGTPVDGDLAEPAVDLEEPAEPVPPARRRAPR